MVDKHDVSDERALLGTNVTQFYFNAQWSTDGRAHVDRMAAIVDADSPTNGSDRQRRLIAARRRYEDLQLRHTNMRNKLVEYQQRQQVCTKHVLLLIGVRMRVQRINELLVAYNRCKDTLEQRISSAEKAASVKAEQRKHTAVVSQEQAARDLNENEVFHRRLLECYDILREQMMFLTKLSALLETHESAALKQETIGLEYRLEYLKEAIERLISMRKIVLQCVQVVETLTTRVESRLKKHAQGVSVDEEPKFEVCGSIF
jgi:hypothetical protein